MSNSNYTTLITSTLEERSNVVRDVVLDNIPLLNRIKKRGNVKKFSGGRYMTHNVQYGSPSSMLFYSGADNLTRADDEFLTAAEFSIKQAAVGVRFTGLEQLQNTGAAQVIDLLEQKLDAAEKNMMNAIDTSLYSDGTGSSGKEITGLRAMIADDPTTGTYGNINRATSSYWRNVASNPGSDFTAGNIQERMDEVALQLVRNGEYADLILADANTFRYFKNSLQAIQRITNADEGAAGFGSLAYYGPGGKADVLFCGGRGGNMPANRMYFINSKNLYWRPHKDCDMVVKGGDRQPVDNDFIVRYMFWAGNLTTDDAAAHGVLFVS